MGKTTKLLLLDSLLQETHTILAMAVTSLSNRLGRLMLQPECLTHRLQVEWNSTSTGVPCLSPVVREPEKYRGVGGPQPLAPGPPPLALVFGWAGAKQSNLSKYSAIYGRHGCTTAQLALPTRMIWNDTERIPELMSNVLTDLDTVGVRERPVVVHCLSDTGIMCYQGMDIATKSSRLDIRGVVWDSCPGPRPEITLPRVAALLAVNWFCARKDGSTQSEALRSCYRLLMDRGWPQYLRRLQGLPLELSLMEGVWAGHFGQNHHLHYSDIPELFLYSNKDYYVSAKYLEREVMDRRRKAGKPFTAVRFQGTRHVQHYRKHKDQYEAVVTEFLRKSFGQVEDIEEVEEELGIIQRDRRAIEEVPQSSGAMERGHQPSALTNHSFGV